MIHADESFVSFWYVNVNITELFQIFLCVLYTDPPQLPHATDRTAASQSLMGHIIDCLWSCTVCIWGKYHGLDQKLFFLTSSDKTRVNSHSGKRKELSLHAVSALNAVLAVGLKGVNRQKCSCFHKSAINQN